MNFTFAENKPVSKAEKIVNDIMRKNNKSVSKRLIKFMDDYAKRRTAKKNNH